MIACHKFNIAQPYSLYYSKSRKHLGLREIKAEVLTMNFGLLLHALLNSKLCIYKENYEFLDHRNKKNCEKECTYLQMYYIYVQWEFAQYLEHYSLMLTKSTSRHEAIMFQILSIART